MANVHPDINKLGLWELRRIGVDHLLSTNQAESFNFQLKSFANDNQYDLDGMIISLLRFSEHRDGLVHRGRYNLGDYTIRKELQHLYDINDPAAKMPPAKTTDDYLDRLHKAKEHQRTWVCNFYSLVRTDVYYLQSRK